MAEVVTFKIFLHVKFLSSHEFLLFLLRIHVDALLET